MKRPLRPTRVLCQAVVDLVWAPEGDRPSRWKVTVTGQPPFAETRVYQIKAKIDNIAAQEGLSRFCHEMEQRPVGELNAPGARPLG